LAITNFLYSFYLASENNQSCHKTNKLPQQLQYDNFTSQAQK